METISTMLSDAIGDNFNQLSGMTVDSESYDAATKALNLLYKLRIDETKIEYETNNKAFSLDLESKKFEEELNLKKAELNLRERELRLKETQAFNEKERFEKEMELKQTDQTLKKEEYRIRKAQIDNDKKRLGVEVLKSAAGIAAFGLGIRSILKFEENGTITSKVFSMIPKVKFW